MNRARGLQRLLNADWSLWAIASVVIVITHAACRNQTYSLVDGLLAGTVAVILVGGAVAEQRLPSARLPVIAWAAIQYYVFWIFPVFLEGVDTRPLTFAQLTHFGAMTTAFIAVAAFVSVVLVAYFSSSSAAARREPREIRTSISIAMLWAYGLFSLPITLWSLLYEAEPTATSAILVITFSPLLAQLLVAYERTLRPGSRSLRALYWLLIAGGVAVGLAGARMQLAILPIIAAMFVHFVVRRSISVRALLFIVGLIIIVSPAKSVYRDEAGFRTERFKSLTVGEIFSGWNEAITRAWFEEIRTQRSQGETISTRLNELSVIAATTHLSSGNVKFLFGDTWLPILYAPIPRFIWADKPNLTEVTNNRFNVHAGFQTSAHAETTTLSAPVVADAFLNFGWFGIALAGLLYGLYFRALSITFSMYSRAGFVLSIYLLTNLRSTTMLASSFVGLVQSVLGVLLIVLLFESAQRALVRIKERRVILSGRADPILRNTGRDAHN
jgi:hypothetical protein